MNARVLYPALFLIFAVSGSPVSGGRLYARLPGTASPLYNLSIENIRTSIRIENLLAVTHVDEEFRNPQTVDLEGFYVFQLPEGAVVDGLWLWVDGKRVTFAVKRIEEAKQIYDSVIHHGIGEPAILQTLGANRFQFKIFPIKAGSTRRIELEYFHTLQMNASGTARYYYPLNLAGYQDEPVSSTGISVDIRADFTLDSVQTNFDAQPLMVRTIMADSSACRIDFGIERSRYTQDLVITFMPRRWFDTFPTMGYALPDTVTDGFFMMWNPATPDPGQEVKSDFVFAIDASGSMTGLRSELVLAAFKEVIAALQPYDRFKVVCFSSGVTRSYPADTGMFFATAEGIRDAGSYLDATYRAAGVTNYEQGIRTAMSTNFRRDAQHRLIFFTDGLPNDGLRSATGLSSIIRERDSLRMQFFPVTTYTERIDSLYAMAMACSGKLTTVEQGDDLKTVLSRLTFDFGSESLEQVRMTFPDSTYHVYPIEYPPAASPEMLVSAGRCIGQGKWPVTLRCVERRSGLTQTITKDIAFAPSTAKPVQVARYWAALRIRRLLEELKGVQDSSEIKESIVRLSEKFMVLSPFTAFLIVNEVDRPGSLAVEAVGTLPETVRLLQNHPNPFHPGNGGTTVISFIMPGSHQGPRHATVRIHDLAGREIATLLDGQASPGVNRLQWDGMSSRGTRVPPGTYFCVLTLDSVMRIIRIIVI